jgi:hypothetical protein
VGWGVFKCGEESYDLSHLNEKVISVEIDGILHAIVVQFSDHCFTEDAAPGDVRPKVEPCSRKDGRFCEKRYQVSLNLLDYIKRATLGSVWLGEGDRCIVVKLNAASQLANPLHLIVPFTLEHVAKGDERAKLRMIVRSAFLRNPSRRIATFGPVKFATLIDFTLKGKTVRRNTDTRRRQPW